MAGYSGTPLSQKLGITPAKRFLAVNAPPELAKELSGSTATPNKLDIGKTDIGNLDLVVIFATDAADLDRRFHAAMNALPADGAIWCAWPKRVSKVPTDITEDLLRELFLPTGMVDNKVCAIDDVWSGLRFVVRKELRSTWNV